MQKIIKVDNKVIVMLDNGNYYERKNVSNALFKQIIAAKTDTEILTLICPEYAHKVQEYNDAVSLKNKIKQSSLLVMKGDSVYWEDVSQLSLPTELIKAIINAEFNKDSLKITTYKNFWTLMCLNPDERCRKNLFWFLNKNGLIISKSGFFVAYRNAKYYKKDSDGEIIYTDAHTGTTRIKIGRVVTMPRSECDSVQEHVCSSGLHAGSRWWLKKNYFGDQGLVVLINPADVVASPPLDSYGKLRTCAYLPIAKAKFDYNGDIIPFNAENGFDCSYITKVIYEGLMGTEEDSPYKIEIPTIPEVDKENITDKLLEIAMKCITEKNI